MADTRKVVECAYCGATFHIKWEADELNKPEFCCFCGETFDDPNEELEDDETPEDEDDYQDESDDSDVT